MEFAPIGVSAGWKHDLKGQHVARVKSRTHVHERHEASYQQSRTDQEHRRHRDFADDHDSAHHEWSEPGRRRGCIADSGQCPSTVRLRDTQRRHQPDREPGERRHSKREQQGPSCPARYNQMLWIGGVRQVAYPST